MFSNSIKKWLLAFGMLAAAALPAHAANKFWNGTCTGGGGASCTNGTFKWDSDSGTAGAAHKCWSTTSAAAGTCTALPTSADVALFDGNSGTASVLVNAPNNPSGAAMVDSGGINLASYAGTLDFSNGGATNNNVSDSGIFNVSGTGALTLTMGTGTYTFTGTGSVITFSNSNLTNPTTCCSGAPIVFSGNKSTTTNNNFLNSGVAVTFGNLTVTDGSGNSGYVFSIAPTTVQPSFNNVTFNGPMTFLGTSAQTAVVRGTLTLNGSVGNYVNMTVSGNNGRFTWNFAGAPSTSITGAIMNRQAFTCGSAGSIPGASSIDMGGNTATTCSSPTLTPPASTNAHIIGGQ